MIITKLQGGLGNQMFQWAAARSYSIDHNCECKLETSFYPQQTLRKIKMNEFPNLEYKIATQSDITKPIIQIGDDFNFKPIPYDENKIVFLNGFYQSEKYFINNQDIIRKELSPSDVTLNRLNSNLLVKQLSYLTCVSIHIRRTDYVNSNGYHPVQTIEYYKKALSMLDYTYVFVFSDDIEWCKENLDLEHMIYLDWATDIESMWIMSMCKYNIIANSSFSWWGAWMNSNPDKKVIAPKKWFGDNGINDSDIVPESWIKI